MRFFLTAARSKSFLYSVFIRKMSSKPNVVFVLGGPGAGKGTQCSLIVKVYMVSLNQSIGFFLVLKSNFNFFTSCCRNVNRLDWVLFWFVSQNFGYVHLSAGDLLREERKREGSKVGQLIDQHFREGSIVPVKITCNLLKNVCRSVALTFNACSTECFPAGSYRSTDYFSSFSRPWMKTKLKEKTTFSSMGFLETKKIWTGGTKWWTAKSTS